MCIFSFCITTFTISQICRYIYFLLHFSIKSLPGEDFNVSATTIVRELGLGHVLVRKDLAKISDEGRCRTGRSRMKLIQDIEGYLEFCAGMMENPQLCEDTES